MRKFWVAVLVVTTGCATVWTKPGGTGEMQADDQLKCEVHMNQSCGYDEKNWATGICRKRNFDDCMRMRGWQSAK